jgi:hypothetical protein
MSHWVASSACCSPGAPRSGLHRPHALHSSPSWTTSCGMPQRLHTKVAHTEVVHCIAWPQHCGWLSLHVVLLAVAVSMSVCTGVIHIATSLSQEPLDGQDYSHHPCASGVRVPLTHVLPQLGQVPDCPIDVLCIVGDVALACSALLVTQALHVKAVSSTKNHTARCTAAHILTCWSISRAPEAHLVTSPVSCW